jgi:hypothetical protein
VRRVGVLYVANVCQGSAGVAVGSGRGRRLHEFSWPTLERLGEPPDGGDSRLGAQLLDLADGVAAAADLRRELLLGEAGLETAAVQVNEVHHGPMLAAGANCTPAWGHVRVKLVLLARRHSHTAGSNETHGHWAGGVATWSQRSVQPRLQASDTDPAALGALYALHNREDVAR